MEEIKIKCPKCTAIDLRINELWMDHCIQWISENGKIDVNQGNLEPGYPYQVWCECKKCNHFWKVRGARQINHILK